MPFSGRKQKFFSLAVWIDLVYVEVVNERQIRTIPVHGKHTTFCLFDEGEERRAQNTQTQLRE